MKKYFGSQNESVKNWTGVCFSNKRLKITCYVNKSLQSMSIALPPAPPGKWSRRKAGAGWADKKGCCFASVASRSAGGVVSTNTLQIVPTEYSLENFQRSNQDTSLTHKPAVFEGNWIQSGDLLTDCASSVGGELSLGQNLLIAYMPWEGYNFEDAILISERLVRDDLYTSVHIERYDIETYETKTGLEQITRDIPDITEKEMQHLDSFGIVKMGAWVEEGDILVGKVTPINKKTISPYQKLLYTILEKQIRPIRDSSLRAPKGIKAKVIDIKYFLRQSSGLLRPKLSPVGNNLGSPRKAVIKKTKTNKLNTSASALPSGKVSPGVGNKIDTWKSAPLPSDKGGLKGITNKKLKGIPQNSKLLQRANLLGESQFSQKKLANSVFLKKINNLFFKKMSKKEKLNFLRFYLFTHLGVKRAQGSRLKNNPGKLTISEVTYLQSLLNSSNLKNKAQVFDKNYKALSKKSKQNLSLGSFSKRGSLLAPGENLFLKTLKGGKFRTGANFQPKNNQKNDKNTLLHNIESIHIYLAEKRKIQVGDKMAGRHGNKGIVSQILPMIDMPFLPDGTPLDMVLNPLGVPSRMNVGQIYECLLGLAGKFLGENYKVFSFDEIYGPEASRSFVFNKLYQARSKTGFQWLFDPSSPGKMRLYDGRTGESFDQKVTVGQAYILRLVHMVDDKIHMRSTGPYSLVTQQPLRGRSKQGGQRLGEMEVWAIEGYGAAFTLLEMLTIKSDDMTGRMTLWSNLILNKDISIGTPESFKVLICELQALCLDIGLFRYMDTNTKNQNSLREITSLVNLP